MPQKKYHIIGGGIAGLTAAKYIKKYDKNARVILYDAAERPGGRCFSYKDNILGVRVDNATHAVLRANKEACKIRGSGAEFRQAGSFFDLQSGRFSQSLLKHWRDIALALFNLPASEVCPKLARHTLRLLFPFIKARQVYFSGNDLSEYFINQHCQYVDELKTGRVLREIEHRKFKVNKLVFAREAVSVGRGEVVILAVDAVNACRILKLPPLPCVPIVTIHFRTSMPLVLPGERHFLGVCGGMVQWLVVNGPVLSVTLSNAAVYLTQDNKQLAAQAWAEICRIRGVQPGFVPPFRVLKYPRATLRQDAATNALRPESCYTKYDNLFLAGDWTMKNWPCSIEAAARSGKRAASASWRKLRQLHPVG